MDLLPHLLEDHDTFEPNMNRITIFGAIKLKNFRLEKLFSYGNSEQSVYLDGFFVKLTEER